MKDKIKCFIECALPTSICNLKCSYCWVDQSSISRDKLDSFDFSVEQMLQALSVKRFGGKCLFSLCAFGETLLQKNLVELVAGLLKNGHYVNLTTNGTISAKFIEILEACKSYISHLHFSFSFHYLELKRKNLINVFFNNIDLVRKAGASFLLQINLVDEYIPYIEDIKKLSIEKVGALPQVALTRDQRSSMKIYSSLNNSEYYEIGQQFQSPLFDFTFKNFNVKRKEFCWAGCWSFVLDMKTGMLRQCYICDYAQNIFTNKDVPIIRKPIGFGCNNCYCVNSSHFLSLGVIPSIKSPTYACLRNRNTVFGQWMSGDFFNFTNSKLSENNKKALYAIRYFMSSLNIRIRKIFKKIPFISKCRAYCLKKRKTENESK